jgi:hypothetical protein
VTEGVAAPGRISAPASGLMSNRKNLKGATTKHKTISKLTTGIPGKGDLCPLLAAGHPTFESVNVRLF